MLITDFANNLSDLDLSLLELYWKRRFYPEEQNKMLNIYEKYIGIKLNRGCGKCRSEYLSKIGRVLKIKENDRKSKNP